MSKKEIKFSIKLDVDGKEQLTKAKANVKELKEAIGKTQDHVLKMGEAFVSFNASCQAVEKLRDVLQGLTADSTAFSAAMAQANTMAGKGGEDFDRLKNSVTELGKEIPMARDALANGLYQVVSNGVPENNWIDYLRASAKASVGGVADLGEVVKVTSTIIKNYGLAWDDATSVQDKIQLTAKNGVTSFEQLAMALPRVTGNAATLGVSIDELLATFSTLTGVTGDTAEVSTQLAAIFTALVKPSSEAATMAQKMGIEFNAAAIKGAGGFQNFLAQLDSSVQAYASKSGMLKDEIYAKLFGSAESLRALGPLTGQLKDSFEKNAEAMTNSAGTINNAFNTMSSTGSATMQLLKNKVAGATDALASIVKYATPALSAIGTAGMAVGGWLQLTKAVNEFKKAMQETALGAKALRMGLSVLQVGVVGLLAVMAIKTLQVFAGQLQKNSNAARMARQEAERLKAVQDGQAKGQAEAANIQRQAAQAADAEAEKIKKLRTVVNDNNAKLRDRLQAIKTLQGIVPGYTAKIDEQGNAYERNTGKVDDYIKKLKELYVVEAAEKKLKALYAKEIKEKGKVDYNRREYAKADKAYQKDRQEQINGTGHGALESFIRGLSLATAGGPGGRSGVAFSEGSAPTKSVAEKNRETKATALRNSENQLASTQNEIKALEGAVKSTVAEIRKGNKGGGNGGGNGGNGGGSGSNKHTTTNNNDTTNEEPKLGSLDWYDKAIQWCDKYIKATDDATAATEMMKKKTALEAARKDLAIKIGIEKPEKAEVKTALEQLRDQLNAAQTEFENAVTIDAKVAASAKVAELQGQIDEQTNGQLSITAETRPTFITKGSTEDKRQSAQNAESRANTIRQDYQIGIIGKDEAERQIAELNKELEAIGLKPIEAKIEVDTEEAKRSMQSWLSTNRHPCQRTQ